MARLRFLQFSKRQKFVISVLVLAVLFFLLRYLNVILHLGLGFGISVLATLVLYLTLRKETKGVFTAPIYILPFLYSLSFALFYRLIPARLLTTSLTSIVFAFGLYSLFLAQNIFAVSSIRTINLLRSARIVSFVLTLLVLFFSINVLFSLQLPFFLPPFFIFFLVFLLSFQSLWTYSTIEDKLRSIINFSLLISLMIMELSWVLIIWPINAAIYSIFLTGIFYTYLGVSHAWLERRLFKGVLWEYVWVGILAVIILIRFSQWGI